MAAPAAEHPRGRLATILRAICAPGIARAGFAFRLALSSSLVALVTILYEIPEGAVAAYVVFFLNRPDRTSSVLYSVGATLAVTVVIGLVLLLAAPVMDQPGLRLAAMASLSVAMLFLTSASKLKPAGGMLAMIIVLALDLVGMVPIGEVATRGLLYAWLFVAIPAGATLLVNLLVGPAPRRLAERALAHRLREAAAILRQTTNEGRPSPDPRDDGTAEILKLLRLARLERTSPVRDIEALSHAAYSTGAMRALVDALARDPDLDLAWREEACTTLAQMADAFDAGGYPVRIVIDPRPGLALTSSFAEVVANFTLRPDGAPPAPEKPRAGFLQPDAFSNPVHIQYALKTTAAAAICYLLYTALDWPQIHTALLTCYIVSLGTAAETVEKLTLRIVGCLIGAAWGVAAILWLMPSLDSVVPFLALVFLGTLAAGWVAGGSPRIAYAGFQIAFAFFLCVIQGSGPALDLSVARDRIIGILLGNFVTYLVFTNLWPVSVTRQVDPAIAALLRALGTLARIATPALRYRALPDLEAASGALRTDLHLVAYEPARLRPSGDWLDRRRRALDAIADLEESLAVAGGDGATADRLDGIAARLNPDDRPAPQPSAATPPPLPMNPLLRRVATGVEELETLLA